MLTSLFIALIRFYQAFLSPLKPKTCRFYPTCSEYSKQVFMKNGFLKGFRMTLQRLLKCHPFHTGGYDPIP